MNLNDLHKIANQHGQKSAVSKQLKFESAFKQGLALLEQAQQEAFTKPATLMRASDALIKALRIHRRDIRPYLALAYLFTLLEDFKTAQDYAYAALKLEPNTSEIAGFIDKMNAFRRRKQVAAYPKDELPSSIPKHQLEGLANVSDAPNYQALYQELERYMTEQTKRFFSAQSPPVEPTLERQQFKALETQFHALNEVMAYIETAFNQIEKGENTALLREKFSPFQGLEKRFRQALDTSKRLLEIKDKIELWRFKTNKQVQVVNQKLTMSALTYGRVDVHRMMDGCDLIADQLDHLSEAGQVDISLVEGSYEQLITLVDSLNGMVDDADSVQENQNKLADILA